MAPSFPADTKASQHDPRRDLELARDASYGKILALAWPASIAASITPLLGAVDVWALGRSDRPLDIAAVGLAAVIFSLAYWTFGFIRMSVAGLTAQAAGADDKAEMRLAFLRAVFLGATIGVLLLILQWPLGEGAFRLLAIGSDASLETFAAARDYFFIRIWGAPFALATYACLGWLTARGRTDFLMFTGILMTGMNIVLDVVFVLKFQWGAGGVAAGTLIAEVTGFFVALGFVGVLLRRDGLLGQTISWDLLFAPQKLRRTLSINRDIFLRTLLLAFSFTWFIQRGGAFGDVTLAANQILLQLFLFTGLALDGTAIAAETLVGQAMGDPDRSRSLQRYQIAVRRGFILATAGAILFAIIYGIWGHFLLGLLAPKGAIYEAAWMYWPWVVASPIVVMVCFQLDGIFVGATQSREMRDSMIVSVLLFLPLSLVLAAYWGNHGLWLAFSGYFLVRAVTLWRYMPRIRAKFLS